MVNPHMPYIPTGPLPTNPFVGQLHVHPISQSAVVWDGSSWLNTAPREWALFLDDDREPSHAAFMQMNIELRVARTVEEAVRLVDLHGLPCKISFDHDLGKDQPPATAFAWHLIHGHMDGKWDCSKIWAVQIHSANPEGGRNIFLLWENFCREFNIVCAIKRVKAIQNE